MFIRLQVLISAEHKSGKFAEKADLAAAAIQLLEEELIDHEFDEVGPENDSVYEVVDVEATEVEDAPRHAALGIRSISPLPDDDYRGRLHNCTYGRHYGDAEGPLYLIIDARRRHLSACEKHAREFSRKHGVPMPRRQDG